MIAGPAPTMPKTPVTQTQKSKKREADRDVAQLENSVRGPTGQNREVCLASEVGWLDAAVKNMDPDASRESIST